MSLLEPMSQRNIFMFMHCIIDDLRKSRGLHSVSAYRHIYRSMPAGVAQSSHAFVGGTVST